MSLPSYNQRIEKFKDESAMQLIDNRENYH
jgi:hypothetical protein